MEAPAWGEYTLEPAPAHPILYPLIEDSEFLCLKVYQYDNLLDLAMGYPVYFGLPESYGFWMRSTFIGGT